MSRLSTPSSVSRPPLVSHFDAFAAMADPDHKPMSEEEVKMLLFGDGATEDTLYEVLEAHNKRWDEMIARSSSGGKVVVTGKKPSLDDPDVMFVDIPDSTYSIRIWDGGVSRHGLFCLDFFDNHRNAPVNSPRGYLLYPASSPHGRGQPLISWEAAMNIPPEELLPGMEKFSVPEGTYWRLTRPNRPDVCFSVPRREAQSPQHFVQPTRRIIAARR